MEKKKYYIGEVEKICSISKKTLRFYDKIGLLSPFEIDDNGYRCYSKENLYTIPIIKYYKQSGFTLECIKKVINAFNCQHIEESFSEKITELEELEKELILKKRSLEAWNSLLKEARMVLEHNLTDIKVKFLEKDRYIYHEQEFSEDYISSIINIDFTNYIESINNAIVGPVIIEFSSLEKKIAGEKQKIRVLQKNLIKCQPEFLTDFGGNLVVACYHIGPHSTIKETYKKMCNWATLHNYKLEEKHYERYIVDFWTTKDEDKFVTEILINIK